MFKPDDAIGSRQCPHCGDTVQSGYGCQCQTALSPPMPNNEPAQLVERLKTEYKYVRGTNCSGLDLLLNNTINLITRQAAQIAELSEWRPMKEFPYTTSLDSDLVLLDAHGIIIMQRSLHVKQDEQFRRDGVQFLIVKEPTSLPTEGANDVG